MDAPALIDVHQTSTDEWPLWAVRARAEREAEEAIELLRATISQVPGSPMVRASLLDALDELECQSFSTSVRRFEDAASSVGGIRDWCAYHEYPAEFLALLKRCHLSLAAAAKALLALKKHEVVTYFHLVPRGSAGLFPSTSPSWN